MSGKPIATVGSNHVCPMCSGTVPHVGGPITGPGVPTVLVNGMPVAVMGDMCTCAGGPDTIIQGNPKILVNGKPIACVGDMTAHGGTIVSGSPNVFVGTSTPAPSTIMPIKEIPFPEIKIRDRIGAAIKGKTKELNEAAANIEKLKEAARKEDQTRLLVEKIEGPFDSSGKLVEELIEGTEYTYKATQFSREATCDELNLHVKWAKQTDDGEISYITSAVNATEEKQVSTKLKFNKGAKIRVYAYCHSASRDASIETPLVCFPICIDRYKIPGLNKNGSDIADDMTYGRGVVTAGAGGGYGSDVVEKYKAEYIADGFDIEKHKTFANIDTKPDNPFDTPLDRPAHQPGSDHFARFGNNTYEQNNAKRWQMADNYDKAGYKKAIYTKEQIYKSKAWIIDKVTYLRSGKDVQSYHEGGVMLWDKSANHLFELFEEYATVCFARGPLEGNIIRMIQKFKLNQGGVYEDATLTTAIANNPATLDYCNALQDYIAEKLKQENGKFRPIIDTIPDVDEGARSKKNKTTTLKGDDGKYEVFSRPIFNSMHDRINGETIAINDIWATEVFITHVEMNGDNYTIRYHVILWDHFGLDLPDLEKLPNTIPYVKETFAVWFALQHLRGYKPFITKISFDKTFKGNLNEGKFERAQQREQQKTDELNEKYQNWNRAMQGKPYLY